MIMAYNIFLQTILFGAALSEWIEITKVGNRKKQVDGSKVSTYTFPSYEITLNRPQLYEITTKQTEIMSHPFPVNFINKGSPSNIKKRKASDNAATPLDTIKDRRVTYTTPKEDIHNAHDFDVEIEKYSIENVTEESLQTKKINKTQNENILERNNNLTYGKGHVNDEHISIDYYEDDYNYEDDDRGREENEEQDEMKENFRDQSVGFMSIVKHVQRELLDFKGRSLNAKAKHLEKLRDDILYEIKYRISWLFKPFKKSESDSRLFTDYYASEHHMDYPSNEGALMTIGFLTFAVFLIKLVLKLIYALKLKQQYYYQPTTTTPASIFLKRSQREIDQDQLNESARILRYLEEYSPS